MYKIAVCDDDLNFLNIMRELLINDSDKEEYEIFEFNSGEALIDRVKELSFDLILLDINMPRPSGFEVAEKIHEITKGDNLVFVSSEEQLVFKCFTFRPLYFVRKLHLKEDLRQAIDKWKSEWNVNSISFDTKDGKIKVLQRDILYIESYRHYIKIFMKNTDVHTVREKISDIYDKLKDKDFIRVHTSFLCNMNYIKKVSFEKVILVDEMDIPISRKYRKQLNDIYNEFILKRLS